MHSQATTPPTLHQSKKKYKYLVSVPVRNGGADNLTGFISLFLYALITNRVFLRVKMTGNITHAPVLEEAYEHVNIDWRPHKDMVGIMNDESKFVCIAPPYLWDHPELTPKCNTGPSALFKDDPNSYSFYSFPHINTSEDVDGIVVVAFVVVVDAL